MEDRNGSRIGFECKKCGQINFHECNIGATIVVWCPRCKSVSSYRIDACGTVLPVVSDVE